MSMPIYVIIYMLQTPISVTGPVPYTLSECIESLKVLNHIPELETTFTCVEADAIPDQIHFTVEQAIIVDQATKALMNQDNQ